MLDKAVGETPLSCAEAYRSAHPELAGVAMAYAGRLDPMASGKLLVLLGDECKNQTNYHNLDKEYQFSVLFGIGSDTSDVLGRLTPESTPAKIDTESIQQICADMIGNIELPYPHFSAKTVQGKPLHIWTLENRLHEITIPTKESTIYALALDSLETKSRTDVCAEARLKIDTIPPVTEARKALGNDFRRVDVRQDWENIAKNQSLPEEYHIAHFTCIASSGTYMRTLSQIIGKKMATSGLAWRIHRTRIGTFDPTNQTWTQEY